MKIRAGFLCFLLLAVAGGCSSSSAPAERCDNDLDDDGDGAADCDDADCQAAPACALPVEVCDNRLDDDRDGSTDCDDSDCASEPACAPPPHELCDNDRDDDGDQAVDCDDPDCAAEPTCASPPQEICDNQLDDDGDTSFDCDDPDCAGVDPCIQLAAPGDIVIVEIMAAPLAVAGTAGEWIELRNTTAADIDISGWVLHDIDASAPEWHIIRGGGPVIVPAGGLRVLGALADPLQNGGVTVDYAWANFHLADDTDEVVLEVKGEQIDTVVYAAPAWPLIEGRSLSLDPGSQTAGANDAPEAWCAGAAAYNALDHGTPGAHNPACP